MAPVPLYGAEIYTHIIICEHLLCLGGEHKQAGMSVFHIRSHSPQKVYFYIILLTLHHVYAPLVLHPYEVWFKTDFQITAYN